jgi:MFS family permease
VSGLRSHRDARIYLSSQALSLLGDNALWLAMGIYVKIVTGSNSAAGITFFAYICGLLTSPVGGYIADRVRRRLLLIVTNFVTSGLVCVLLLAHSRGQVWLIYLVLFGYGVSGGVISAAQTALLVVMLPAELLDEANSVLQVAEMGLRVITPLIGAGLLALVGPKPVILIDAGTFAVAGFALLTLRLRESVPSPATQSWRSEMTAGLRHIGHTQVLRRLLVSCVAALLVFGFFQTVQFAVVSRGLHHSPTFVGVLESLLGAGAITGGLLAPLLMRRTGERRLVVIALISAGLVCPLLITSVLPAVLAAMAVVGACIVWVNIAAFTLIQRRTPHELIGRVSAAVTTTAMVPQAVSIALGAALIAVVNYRILLIVMSAAYLLSGIQLMSWPERGATRAPASSEVVQKVDVSQGPEQ